MGKFWKLIKNNLLIVFVFGFSILIAALLTIFAGKPVTINIPNSFISTPKQISSFTMQGKTGMDALALLKEDAKVKVNREGQIVAINKDYVSNLNDEYWVFYVNGKLVHANPQQYQTNNTDLIIWKIEKRSLK